MIGSVNLALGLPSGWGAAKEDGYHALGRVKTAPARFVASSRSSGVSAARAAVEAARPKLSVGAAAGNPDGEIAGLPREYVIAGGAAVGLGVLYFVFMRR